MKIALIGNPNCGKTTLFNRLTGSTAHVGNWPGVTVEKREGLYKGLKKQTDERIEIVDLPGIYSLSPYTPEEIVSRNFMIDEHPDLIINIVDATNLERNLYLTTQVLEADVPVLVALNMMDAVERSGDEIDVDGLSTALGVPVNAISALKGKGVKELMQRAVELGKTERKGVSVLENSECFKFIERIRDTLAAEKIEHPLFHATKLIEGDTAECTRFPNVAKAIEGVKNKLPDNGYDGDYEAFVADMRYRYIAKNYSPCLKRATHEKRLSRSDKADKVLTHRVWAIPLFIVIMFVVFHVTFSEDILFLNSLFGVTVNNELFASALMIEPGECGVPSLGVWLQSLLGWCTGSLIDVSREGLIAAGYEGTWVEGFLCDGLLSGIDSVLSFVPQVLLLYLFLSIMEDTGYMARVAFILDRAFRRFGLSGRAFMPLLMCFGCAVPGIIATKSLENEKERRLTIMLSPFFSCGAKLPIWATFASIMANTYWNGYGDLTVFIMYFMGIAVAIIAAVILKMTMLKGDPPPFIMELPAYHRPQFKSTMIHLWDKAKHLLVRTGTVIAVSIIVIWFLSSFGKGGYCDIDVSILGYIGRGLQYLFYPVFAAPNGFVSTAACNEYAWRFVVAAFTGLIAKEMVVATLGTLAGVDGDAILEGAASEADQGAFDAMIGSMTPAAMFAYMAFNLFSVPCMAAVGAAMGELNSRKKSAIAIGFWLLTAYVVSFVVFWLGNFNTYMWGMSLAVTLILIALIAFAAFKLVKKFKAQRVAEAAALAAVAATDDSEIEKENTK
ncbi:MAG: ferrous iron transporter B [Clostridiales bacterium]|nr:ferrous iron transporter B [Clostridiales bacterium]